MQFQEIFIPPPPTEGQRKFQGGRVAKLKVFEDMYGAKLEFLEGWKGGAKNILDIVT